MDDLLTEFVTETSENLAVIDAELVKFEQNPNDAEILGNIFRLVHTIKGTCGFFGLPRLESIAHAGENVLEKFRAGELDVTPDAVTQILRCIDTIRDLLAALGKTGEEPEGEDSDIIQALNAVAQGVTEAAPKATMPETETAPFGDRDYSVPPSRNEFGAPVAAELLEEVAAASQQGIVAATDRELESEMMAERASEAAVQPPVVRPESPASASAPVTTEKSAPPVLTEKSAEGDGGVAASSIRVNVDVLEHLMTLISELVLTRNQLLQMVRGHDDSEFNVPLQRLSHITSDLQGGVMKTRMQPIGNAWAQLPRVIRNMAVQSGKKIELVMLGADTELDRQVLELIKDPLTHMIRNSADHGLELPEDRTSVGKPETGTITLNAFHEGGHIIIQIKDDGRGLNTDRIVRKIVENGLATEAELGSLTDTQIQQYIFRPGFSTAEAITNISGRGIGMDVVRTNIERIGGTVDLQSREGVGTTFIIKIPLTLAIVSALIVECAGERFAIPQISVLELVRASDDAEHSIEMINDSPVLRLRDRLLPLISLQSLLQLEDRDQPVDDDTDTHVDEDEIFIVVTQVGTSTFGIIVHRVFDTEEIVVKPVSPILREINAYSGNTILGDGSVIMILDPNGIAAQLGHASHASDEVADHDAAQQTGSDDQREALLVFRAGENERKAVPLALIARLEEIDLAQVETAHGLQVVQYREHLMPLIPFSPDFEFATEGRVPVLVFTDNDRSMGLVVDGIVDIVDDKLNIELATRTPGIVGTATIAGKATDIIDSAYYLTRAFPDWFGNTHSAVAHGANRRALLVDDSQFFRNLLTPLLSVAGWQVETVASAEDALKLRDEGFHYDVIISDIEMPGMSGFEFAEEVRTGGKWQAVPMIALSSNTAEDNFSKGRKSGFSDYIAKHDRDTLINTLAQTVASATSTKNG